MATNDELNHILDTGIKKLRGKQGLTREQLSEILDISARFLADAESGQVGVSLTTWKNVCDVLSASTDYLLGLSSYSDEQLRYIELDSKIKQIPPEHIENFDKILCAFLDTVNK